MMRVATKLPYDADWIEAQDDDYATFEEAALGEGAKAGISGGDIIAVKDVATGEEKEFIMEMELTPRWIGGSGGRRQR